MCLKTFLGAGLEAALLPLKPVAAVPKTSQSLRDVKPYEVSEGRGKSHSSVNATRAERSPALSGQSPLAKKQHSHFYCLASALFAAIFYWKTEQIEIGLVTQPGSEPQESPNLLACFGDQKVVLVAGACVLRMHANPPCALLAESRGHIGRNQYMQLLQKLLLYLRDASESCRGQSSSSSAVTWLLLKHWGQPIPRVQQLAWQKSCPVLASIKGHFPKKMTTFCRMKSFPLLHLNTKTEFPFGNVLMVLKLLQLLANSAQ